MRIPLVLATAALALGLLGAGCNGKCSKDGDCLNQQRCEQGVCQPLPDGSSSGSSGSSGGASGSSSSSGGASGSSGSSSGSSGSSGS